MKTAVKAAGMVVARANNTLVRMLEELAANAWPAHVQQQFGSWRLRASEGVTRRANSVLCLSSMPAYAGWYEEVVNFYGRWGLPIRFQVSEAAPEGLDAILQGMGYAAEAHSAMYIAHCVDVVRGVEASDHNLEAINLYTRLGFRYLYGYHYRVAEKDPRGSKPKRTGLKH